MKIEARTSGGGRRETVEGRSGESERGRQEKKKSRVQGDWRRLVWRRWGDGKGGGDGREEG